MVIALIVTPEGFPLAYEVMAGNTSDKTTLKDFLKKIADQYGQARRIWVMDRGIPTEEVLAEMRASQPPVEYLVGTPKARLNKLEEPFSKVAWQPVREGVEAKLLTHEGEIYVLVESRERKAKERSMRRRQLKWLIKRLKAIQGMKLERDEMMMKLGAAHQQAPTAWRFVTRTVTEVPPNEQAEQAEQAQPEKQPEPKGKKKKPRLSKRIVRLEFELDRDHLQVARKREGRYLLRSNMVGRTADKFWEFYLQLV